MTKKVAVGSLKGGVGKTTVAVNLACALAGTVSTVVLVDLDAQSTATEWLEAGHLPITGQGLAARGAFFGSGNTPQNGGWTSQIAGMGRIGARRALACESSYAREPCCTRPETPKKATIPTSTN